MLEEDSSAKTRAAVAVADEDELGGEGREVYDRERTDVLDCFAGSDDEEKKKKVEGADPLLEVAAGRVEEVKRDRVEDRLRRYDRSGDVVVTVERCLEDWAADWKDRLRRRECAEQEEEEEEKETVPWPSRQVEAERAVRENIVERK